MKRNFAALAALIVAVAMLVIPASAASAATCTSEQTPWAKTEIPGYGGWNDDPSFIFAAVKYRRCVDLDGRVSFRATDVGGRFKMGDETLNCDGALSGFVGLRTNFDNRAGDIIVGYDPPSFTVDCQADGANSNWLYIGGETSSIYKADLDTWLTYRVDWTVIQNNNPDDGYSKWGHLYE